MKSLGRSKKPLGRKVTTNLDSILKNRDITLPTKVRLVKAMVFPVVMYGCESWTVKKAELRRIDAFELWCWTLPTLGREATRLRNFSTKQKRAPSLCESCPRHPHPSCLQGEKAGTAQTPLQLQAVPGGQGG